jgi:hypothetical protein
MVKVIEEVEMCMVIMVEVAAVEMIDSKEEIIGMIIMVAVVVAAEAVVVAATPKQ